MIAAHQAKDLDNQGGTVIGFLIRHLAHRCGHGILAAQRLHSAETAHDVVVRFARFDRDFIGLKLAASKSL